MARLSLGLLIALALSVATMRLADATEAPSEAGPDTTFSLQQEIGDNDDTRVEVQLAVLAVAVFVVVVIGGIGYCIRKKLGLVAPPPEQHTDGHHGGG